MHRIAQIIQNDSEMMEILEIVRTLHLPDGYVAAGFVRGAVWDALHRYEQRTPLLDIDVIYFDASNLAEEQDLRYQELLRQLDPTLPWSVKNQARMHIRNKSNPYRSVCDAMSRWPETATAVAVRLNQEDRFDFVAPFGERDLFNLVIRRSPYFTDRDFFHKRIDQKQWLAKWPKLQVVDSD